MSHISSDSGAAAMEIPGGTHLLKGKIETSDPMSALREFILGGPLLTASQVKSSAPARKNSEESMCLFAPNLKGCTLLTGSFAVLVDQDLSVKTELGQIDLKKGALVYIMLNAQGLNVFSLNQRGPSDVTLRSKGKTIKLYPGNQVLLTAPDTSIGKLPKNFTMVPHRQFTLVERNDSSCIYSADFSIFDLMTFAVPILEMKFHRTRCFKGALRQMLKNHVILCDLNCEGDEYPETSLNF